MLMVKEGHAAIRTLQGWAISVLQEAGDIRECEEHDWMLGRADPHARARALVIARRSARRPECEPHHRSTPIGMFFS